MRGVGREGWKALPPIVVDVESGVGVDVDSGADAGGLGEAGGSEVSVGKWEGGWKRVGGCLQFRIDGSRVFAEVRSVDV